MLKYIFSIILLFAFASPCLADSTYMCGRGSSCSYTDTTGCSYGSRTNVVTIMGYYDTEAEAVAASAQGMVALKAAYPTWTNAFFSGAHHACTGVDDVIWHVSRATVTRCTSTVKFYYSYNYYYKRSTWVDENNDCSQDEMPPDTDIPEIDQPDCMYRKVLDVKDENGALQATLITTKTGSEYWIGNASYAEDCISGDNSEVECVIKRYFEIGSTSWIPCASLPAAGTGSPTVNNTQNEIDLYPNLSVKTEIEGVESGENTEVGDTDSEIFTKINDNIVTTNDNLKVLGDKLAQVEANTRQGIGSSGGGDTIVNVESEGNGVKVDNGSSTVAQLDQKFNDENYDLSEDFGSQNLNDYKYGSSDTEEVDQGTIAQMLDSFLARSPTSDFMEKISLTSSGPACDFNASFELFGKQIDLEFSFCDIEAYLELMGNLLFILCGISFIIIIFR